MATVALQRVQAGRPCAVVVHAAQKGFGKGRAKAGRRATKPESGAAAVGEAKQLLGEYSAVKQHGPSRGVGLSGTGSRAPAPDRTKRTMTEASAAASPTAPDHAAGAGGGGGVAAAKGLAQRPAQAAQRKVAASAAAAAAVGAAAPAAPDAPPAPAGAAADAPTAEPAAPAEHMPPAPPLPASFTAAGARHSAFESKVGLTGRAAPPAEPALAPAPADDAPAAGADRLAAVRDLEAAAQHVGGLATLLEDAQVTLASLRTGERDAAAAGTAAAAASAAADNLVGLMGDVLSDIRHELELVAGELLAARGDVSALQQALEDSEEREAAASAALAAAALAAATAAPAPQPAAPEWPSVREEALEAQIKLREAELDLSRQRVAELEAQLQEQRSATEAAAAAAVSAAAEAAEAAEQQRQGGAAKQAEAEADSRHPMVRALLARQAAANMAVLDRLGALTDAVVRMDGLEAAQRLALASAVSKCVLAVGPADGTLPDEAQ